jgi:hypothetical protein
MCTPRVGELWLHPTPNWTAAAPANGSLQIDYIAEESAFSDDSTDMEAPNNVFEWIILDCLCKCGSKDEQSISVWASQRDRIERRILSSGPVDIGEPKTVVSTSGRVWSRNSRNPRHRMLRTP